MFSSSVAQPSVGLNPVPTVGHCIPQVQADNGDYQLTVEGTNFVPGAVMEWNGEIRSTVVNSATLIADVPASDVATAGTAIVTVINSPFTGHASPAHTYTILAPQ